MARAHSTYDNKDTYIRPTEVTLKLTGEEAELLRSILYTGVIGDGVLRNMSNNISDALASAGVRHNHRCSQGYIDTRTMHKIDWYEEC
jgi:hypothetical protein